MSTSYLINHVRVGGRLIWPGTALDSAKDAAKITAIQAEGGVLAASTVTQVVTASPIALGLKQKGGEPTDASLIMIAALLSSK